MRGGFEVNRAYLPIIIDDYQLSNHDRITFPNIRDRKFIPNIVDMDCHLPIVNRHEGYPDQRPGTSSAISTGRWVRKWRGRWQAAPQLESLYERERPGRPPVISQQTRREVINIASSRPEYDSDSRRTTWSQEQIADELERKTAVKISRSSVQRILGERGQRSSRRRQ